MKKFIIGKMFVLTNMIFASSIFCQNDSVPKHELYRYYANTFPDNGMPEWGNEKWGANGITHDSLNWYFSAINRTKWFGAAIDPTDWILLKVPVKYNINNFSSKAPGVVTFQFSQNLSLNDTLRRYNYTHIGDIDHYKYKGIDYLVAPLTGNGQPIIAFFRAKDLVYINYALLSNTQNGAGWCAIAPKGNYKGDLFTSSNEAEIIFHYKINWEEILNPVKEIVLTVNDSFIIKDSSEKPIVLRNMQGGEFTPTGRLLYVSCGVNYCLGIGDGQANAEDGIHVFETTNWTEVLKSTNSKRDGTKSTFDFAFDNTNCNDEPEGLTIWDIDNMQNNHDSNTVGHLHAMLTNHNKFQIIHNTFENIKYYAPIQYGIYKVGAKIGSWFSGHKVHTAKVSLKHYGPTPYSDIANPNSGYSLNEEEKKDSVFLEEAFNILLQGDTLRMINYLADNIDENGNLIDKTIVKENPVDKTIQVFPDNSQKLIPEKGLWLMPSVTVGTKYCTNPFGLGVFDADNKIVIKKGRIDKNCNLINPGNEIFTKNVYGKLIHEGVNILNYVPVLLPSNNNYLNPESPFPFSIYNYFNDWNNEGDSYFTVTSQEINAWGTCKSHKGLGHSRYSYFLGPENDFSCGNFRSFMSKRNKNPQLITSQKINYPLFRFSFFIPLTNGIHITDALGNFEDLPQIDLGWLKGANNTNKKAFQNFFYNLAVIAAADPSFRFLEKPELYNKPRAVVTGNVNGRTYLAGIDDSGIYSPVDCGDGKQTSLLIEKLIGIGGSNYETSPLKRICKQYMDDENNRDVIKAFLPSDISIYGVDLKTDLEYIDRKMKNLNQVPSNVKFLIQKSNRGFFIDDNGPQKQVNWYSNIQKSNLQLSRLAILYGDDINAYEIDDKIVLFGIKSIYSLCANNDKEVIIICDLLKDYGKQFNYSTEQKKKAISELSSIEYKSAQQNYHKAKKDFETDSNEMIKKCNCEK